MAVGNPARLAPNDQQLELRWGARHHARVTAGTPSYGQRPEVAVRYLEVADELSQIQTAWPSLEAAVGTLTGRRFLAAFDPVECWYRACVETRADTTDAERRLPEMLLPGGRFLRVRLRGKPPGLYEEIGPAYRSLLTLAARDDTRPSLEHYRRHDQIDILMPVAER